MGRFDPVDAVAWTIRLVKAVEQLHKTGSAHGGICPAAIVEGATSGANAELSRLEGAEPFGCFGPERLADGEPSTMQDVWAVGTVLYFLLTGTMPFSGRSAEEVRSRIHAGPPNLTSLGVNDRRLQTLIERLFAPRLSMRIVAATPLREALERWRPELRLRWLPPLALPPEPFEIRDRDSQADVDTAEYEIITRQVSLPSRAELEDMLGTVLPARKPREEPEQEPLDAEAEPSTPPPPRSSSRPMVITAAVILGLEAAALSIWQLAK